jgi:D-inositol-3-phosphate glycosyltransferase
MTEPGTVKIALDATWPGVICPERQLGRSVDGVIVQAQEEIDELIRLGVPRDRMTLVPSGVNTDRFAPGGPSLLAIKSAVLCSTR